MNKSFGSICGVALLAITLSAPLARAESEGEVDAALTEQVTTALTALGYEVRSVGMEEGMIEVEAIKDGKTCEVFLAEDLTIDHETCN